jgi:SAM-dependent methyltransferase
VADLGCGPGHDLALLRARGFDAVGVDLSSGMLALAREQGPVVQGDLRRPPLQDGAFDGVWSSAALLHVPMPDVASTLAAWHRLLRPGGRLGLCTSLGGEQGWELVPYATPKPVPLELSRWYVHHDRGHLLTLLSEAGFLVEQADSYQGKRSWLQVHATA